MARINRDMKGKGPAADDFVRPSPWQRSRLSTMPLAVLLPVLSDVGQLGQFREDLESCLEGVQEKNEAADSDDRSRLQVEQNMLQQVFQWLDAEAKEE